ncbi:hypothetical protein B0I37DRAFT_405420 [Chaetomium sp. MPI-CAGE-AT-0009]|nr:hypothetical protein B0I37DRAFT_405420 [Chaetomium sp. MPI-CAGE-AT-0009]
MSDQEKTNKDELSFGIELEFLFYYKDPQLDDARDARGVVVDEEEELELPPALVLPNDVFDDPFEDDDSEDEEEADDRKDGESRVSKNTPRRWAADLIRQAILSVPGAKLERTDTVVDQPHRDMYVVTVPGAAYGGWSVKRDGSVHDDYFRVRGYSYRAFEVASPALWDRPESHRHVHQVVQELINRFRLRVNLSTGLHCHVGAGIEPVGEEEEEGAQERGDTEQRGRFRLAKHPLGVLKRAAALMWAADGFMAQAFPPERGLSNFAPPIGLCSRLAHGIQLTHYDDPEHPHEQPLPPPPPNIPPQPSPPPTSRASTQTTSSPPSAPTQSTPPPKPASTRSVQSRPARAEVAALFESPAAEPYYDRPNYNLQAYRAAGWADRTKPAATVEFREAPGSLDPAWVGTWVRVGGGAGGGGGGGGGGGAEGGGVSAVEEAHEEQHQPRYDVISLLMDMGLFAEALFLERKLCSDPLQFWYPCRLAEAPRWFEDDDLPEPRLPPGFGLQLPEPKTPPPDDPRWVRRVSRAGDDDYGDDDGGVSSNATSPLVPTPTWMWLRDQEFRPDQLGLEPQVVPSDPPPVYDESETW